ncbi:MAG: hypothetical protein AAFU67_06195 [Bacteroidota bacterium]
MNQSYLLGATIVLLFLSCQNNTSNPTPLSTGEMTVVDTASYQPLYVHPLLADVELNAQNTALGGYGQIMSPPMERSEAQLLTKAYWVFEFYHDPNGSAGQRKRGAGQWFRFSPDGSFTGGHWGRQTHAGLWYLLYDGNHRYLTIDSNVDQLDGKWDIQAIGSEQDAMGWVRQNDFGPKLKSPVQGKLIELYNVPTKEQFHVED